jgi:hypothetical protein
VARRKVVAVELPELIFQQKGAVQLVCQAAGFSAERAADAGDNKKPVLHIHRAVKVEFFSGI